MTGALSACVIQCPGRWEDSVFEAVQLSIEGVSIPFVMLMPLPKVTVHALAQQVNPSEVYQLVAKAINQAGFVARVA